MAETLDEYRTRIRAAGSCPFCRAQPGDRCRKQIDPVSWELVEYVHDDRCLSFDLINPQGATALAAQQEAAAALGALHPDDLKAILDNEHDTGDQLLGKIKEAANSPGPGIMIDHATGNRIQMTANPDGSIGYTNLDTTMPGVDDQKPPAAQPDPSVAQETDAR